MEVERKSGRVEEEKNSPELASSDIVEAFTADGDASPFSLSSTPGSALFTSAALSAANLFSALIF